MIEDAHTSGVARGRARAVDLGARSAATIFLAFAFGYFFSALLRAITATLAPAFSAELSLHAGDLGLLAGAYFLGFSLLQLPLGLWLDRFGPKRVLLCCMAVAAVACGAFAMARTFPAMIAARMLIGVGVGASLMAPLTCFRHRFDLVAQMRANSWMLMTGSLGMLASTLPVQWLLPAIGWRGLFWSIAFALVVASVLIAWTVPRDVPDDAVVASDERAGYGAIFRHPAFVCMAPLGFINYGGMVAVQSLWAGPWLTEVAGRTPQAAAQGLFGINLSMLVVFLGWGAVMPRFMSQGWTVERLIALGVPLSLVLLATNVALGSAAGAPMWAAWCVSSTFLSLSQPAVAQAFPAALAGKALSAYNLVIFVGVFAVQWGIGLSVDLLVGWGCTPVDAYRASFAMFLAACTLAYAWFMWRRTGARAGPA